jgi:hypothetical protein
MKHGDDESLKVEVTLDTTCLIDSQRQDTREDIRKRAEAVKKIIDWYQDRLIDVKVTTRVEFDQRNYQNEEKKEKLLNLADNVGVIGSVFRYGISKYGGLSNHVPRDGYGSLKTVEMEKRLKEIMFEGISFGEFNEKSRERISDVDHLLAHILAKRDFFITSDKRHFINNREKLKAEFSVVIITPEEFVKMYENG